MIRVAYIVSTLKRCGPSNQLRCIIRHLDRTQFQPVVITLSPESNDSVRSLFEADGIEVVSLGLSRLAGLMFSRRRLRQLLRTLKVDVLHTQGVRADGLSAALSNEWPGVCSVRNFPQLDFPMTYGPLRGKWMAAAHTRALRRIAAPCGVSAAVSKNLLDVFGVTAQTVCNGVDTTLWTPASSDEPRAQLRQQLGFADEQIVWVSVGHLSERKDPLAIIRAFRAAATSTDCLCFLGGGPLEKECADAVSSDDRIRLAGRVDRVADYLQAADAFVSASHAEGFPNAVLEALACGLPCVLSDIPPHTEIATRAPECVQVYAEGEEAPLRAGLSNLKPTLAMRAAARRAAEDEFSAAGMSATYQAIYQELAHA